MLDGPLSPNAHLEIAPQILAHFERPDDAVLGADGALYVSDGKRILRCESPDFSQAREWARFDQAVSALAVLPDGGLVAALEGEGLRLLDQQGIVRHSLGNSGDRALRCITALAVTRSGHIYFCDASQFSPSGDWLQDLMSTRAPSGAIFVADPHLRRAELKVDGLAWPNGLALADDDKALWFNEAWNHSLSRMDVASGQSRVVQPNLAFYPARLRADSQGNLWQACFALRSPLVEFVLREHAYREDMIATISPDLWIGPSLRAGVDCREPAQFGSLKKLGIHKPWAPARSYGLVVKFSPRGAPSQSWHSRVDGSRHGVTSVCPLPDGDVLAVSKGHGLLLRLSASRSHQGE